MFNASRGGDPGRGAKPVNCCGGAFVWLLVTLKKTPRTIPLVLLCVPCLVLTRYAEPVAIDQFVVLPLLILCLISRPS